ncbi:MAG: hypothetical protein QOH86_709 [Sphingomonadales bacterium]|jgi:hypothetical protein|nr:hypothetical protein [Sphingomonadales bacterium]
MPDFSGIFSGFFEGAAGIVILFAALSWASSKIVEIGQSFFNVHGKMLRSELARWFGEDEDGPFTHYFYLHPLIEPLSQRRGREGLRERLDWLLGPNEAPLDHPRTRLPAYIAPETFTAFAINPFPWPTTEAALKQMLEGNADPDADCAAAASYLAGSRTHLDAPATWGEFIGSEGFPVPAEKFDGPFKNTPIDLRNEGYASPPDGFRSLVDIWRKNKLVPRSFCSRIVALLGDSENDLDRFRAGAARWYNEAMDRLTGRFKRNALIWAAVVALAFCTFLNVNSITLFSSVFANSGLNGPVDPKGDFAAAGDPDLPAKRQFNEDFTSCNHQHPRKLRDVPETSTGVSERQCLNQLLSDLGHSTVRPFFWALPLDLNADAERARFVLDYCMADSQKAGCGDNMTTQLRKCTSPTLDDVKPIAGDKPQPGDLTKAKATFCSAATEEIIASPVFFWDGNAARAVATCLRIAISDNPRCNHLLDVLRPTFARSFWQANRADRVQNQLPRVAIGWPFHMNWDSLMDLLGILISTFLITLGAPFWYDLLSKISGRGTTGPKPGQS